MKFYVLLGVHFLLQLFTLNTTQLFVRSNFKTTKYILAFIELQFYTPKGGKFIYYNTHFFWVKNTDTDKSIYYWQTEHYLTSLTSRTFYVKVFLKLVFCSATVFLSVSADTDKFFFLINSKAIFHQICYNDSNIGGLFGPDTQHQCKKISKQTYDHL